MIERYAPPEAARPRRAVDFSGPPGAPDESLAPEPAPVPIPYAPVPQAPSIGQHGLLHVGLGWETTELIGGGGSGAGGVSVGGYGGGGSNYYGGGSASGNGGGAWQHALTSGRS